MHFTGFNGLVLSFAIAAVSGAAHADPYAFSTGAPDGRLASTSGPSGAAQLEIETADDFLLTSTTSLSSASFTGLLTSNSGLQSIGEVAVEIYRVFPLDSTNPPSGKVTTRVNSPSDVAFDSRSGAASQLSFNAVALGSLTAANSVINGIHPFPNELTGGDGVVNGEEVRFDLSFTSALVLPAGHYFFVPQVTVAGGSFLWLSAQKPISGPGTTPLTPDLQSWIRSADLAPDWLRIGTDIVGTASPFNASFSLTGQTIPAVPEPSRAALMLLGGVALAAAAGQRRRRAAAG